MTWRKAAVTAVILAVIAAIAVTIIYRNQSGEPAAAPSLAPPSTSAAASPSAQSDHWVGTWAVAVQHLDTTFEKRTFRQILHTSIGGTSARLRISNEYGTGPLEVRDVHLARPTAGSGVDTSTDTAVTFDGAPEVIVPGGKSVTSDPVDFAVPELSDVAVSFYLPATAGPATIHGLANRDNYVAAGDQAGAGKLDGAHKAASYYYVMGLDVVNPDAEGAVVAFGASVTDGFGSTFGENKRWPDLLARRLAGSGRTVAVLNAGISGNKLTKDGSGASALARFDRDVATQPGVRWVIISDDPLNDLGDPDPPSSDEVIDALAELIGRAHAAGIRVLCSTLTPFQGAGYWSAEAETGRQAVNDFVRGTQDGSESGCDAVVDQDTATHDPAAPTRYRAAYDSGDHLHPNDAGMKAIAGAIDLAEFK